MRILVSILFAGLLLALAAGVQAGVGDPTLETDHPDYAGEGAFQTVEQCVRFATAKATTPQEKAIALYIWMLKHQFHLMSPQEWCVPGLKPNSQAEQADLIVYDAERARFSYGFGLCGTVHAWNEPYWKALGMGARRRAFPGHTNSEIEYDGSWHAFDTDMAGLVFRKDGVVAGYEDIIKNPALFDVNKAPLPQYPFAWPSDNRSMKDGWKEVAKKGNWFKMYNGGYAGQPGIVNLRSGETFTRYFDRDHFGADKRIYWHNLKGGPFRDWTFVNIANVEHNGAKVNARGNASYCNGEFIYRPDLSKGTYRDGVAEQSANVTAAETSPRLRVKDGGEGSVAFQHFSPYVIAGRPADGVNPMTAPASNGLVVSGETVGPVSLDVSNDQGQTWIPVGEVTGKFEKDLTEQVKGRYGYQTRFRWKGQGGLDALAFTTVTQVAQPMYPRLKPDGSNVVYRSGARAVLPVLPNFGQDEAGIVKLEDKTWRSGNVAYVGKNPKSRLPYVVQGNKPGSVVFRIDAPTNLVQVNAAIRYPIRVPPPENADYRLDISTDGGKTWKLMSKAVTPKDNEYSSGWLYGSAAVTPGQTKSALVRVNLYQGGFQAGLLAAEFYGIHETGPRQATKITYGWNEGGKLKTHVENVPAEAREHTFRVPTGKAITDSFVRMELP